MIKVVVTDLEYRKAEHIFKDAEGFECIMAPSDELELAAMIRKTGAKYAIIGVNKYTRELYDVIPAGGVIARFGVGHDGVDRELAERKKIYCTNTPGVLDDSVAECAVGMLLIAARNFTLCAADNKNGIWKNRTGVELAKKTIAVIGCGNIGRKVAGIVKNAFTMNVIGYDVTEPKRCEVFDTFTTDYEKAVKDADFVSLHIPDIPATHNFINTERLLAMKDRAWLLNTARGSVLCEDDLFDAVRLGKIGGAVLDVFKNEPYIPASKDLRNLENIILLPHIGSSTIEACRKMAEAALFNIRCCRDGKIGKMNLIQT